MSVQMIPELEQFVEQSVQSGYYDTPREVMEEALRLLQQKTSETERKKAKVQAMIEEGMKGPSAPMDIDGIVRRAENELDQEERANG